MDKVYEPVQVYLLRQQGDGVVLGELVEHKWAEETSGTEQACVYIALLNPAGEIYIQHRAGTKRLWPNRKTISTSGHVDPGETFEQAAVREVMEELGVELTEEGLRPVGFFTGLSHCGPVYEAHSDQVPKPRPEELDAERSGFVSMGEVRRLLSTPDVLTPSGARALEIWVTGGQ